MDAFPSLDASSTVFNSNQEEEDDGWVIVKKQKVNILIPPPSPQKPTMQPRAAKRRSLVKEIRQDRPPRTTTHQKTTSILPKHKSEQGIEVVSRTRPTDNNGSGRLVLEPKPPRPPASRGAGNVGAMEVVNRRIRARNIQRKLRQLGGIRSWLESRGLGRFAAIFERRKLSEYQMVNLTTRNLEDLGMNAVGTRRKLIHAIDLLCQPYFLQGPK